VPDANPLKPLLKQIEHLAAYATTYRYPSPSGNIKPAPDDATLLADVASLQAAALSATATAFGVDLSKQDLRAKTAKPVR
jgi:sulfite reductase beta subunit-like hemoprotein